MVCEWKCFHINYADKYINDICWLYIECWGEKLRIEEEYRVVLMAQRLARREWRSGGPRFKSHPRLTFQSWSSYQLNQMGSKAASDSTLKQLTTCGVSNTSTLLLLIKFQAEAARVAEKWSGCCSIRMLVYTHPTFHDLKEHWTEVSTMPKWFILPLFRLFQK